MYCNEQLSQCKLYMHTSLRDSRWKLARCSNRTKLVKSPSRTEMNDFEVRAKLFANAKFVRTRQHECGWPSVCMCVRKRCTALFLYFASSSPSGKIRAPIFPPGREYNSDFRDLPPHRSHRNDPIFMPESFDVLSANEISPYRMDCALLIDSFITYVFRYIFIIYFIIFYRVPYKNFKNS